MPTQDDGLDVFEEDTLKNGYFRERVQGLLLVSWQVYTQDDGLDVFEEDTLKNGYFRERVQGLLAGMPYIPRTMVWTCLMRICLAMLAGQSSTMCFTTSRSASKNNCPQHVRV